jgi:ferredoxin
MPGVIVDRERCFGFARCIEEVPEVFSLDAEGKSKPSDLGEIPIQRVIEAAWACPRQAISMIGDDGVELPESVEART